LHQTDFPYGFQQLLSSNLSSRARLSQPLLHNRELAGGIDAGINHWAFSPSSVIPFSPKQFRCFASAVPKHLGKNRRWFSPASRFRE
jgi:hypothetical protein